MTHPQTELPKAALFWIRWDRQHFYFAKFRLANAMRVQIGWLVVTWRMPWLKDVARRLHPECFDQHGPAQ